MELAGQIAELWPHITVILASGRMQPEEDQALGVTHFFRKPYNLDLFRTVIADLAGKPKGSPIPPLQ